MQRFRLLLSPHAIEQGFPPMTRQMRKDVHQSFIKMKYLQLLLSDLASWGGKRLGRVIQKATLRWLGTACVPKSFLEEAITTAHSAGTHPWGQHSCNHWLRTATRKSPHSSYSPPLLPAEGRKALIYFAVNPSYHFTFPNWPCSTNSTQSHKS